MLRLDKVNTSMCRTSGNMGAATSWKLRGLSRPVYRQLYFQILTHSVIQFSCIKLKSDEVFTLFVRAILNSSEEIACLRLDVRATERNGIKIYQYLFVFGDYVLFL